MVSLVKTCLTCFVVWLSDATVTNKIFPYDGCEGNILLSGSKCNNVDFSNVTVSLVKTGSNELITRQYCTSSGYYFLPSDLRCQKLGCSVIINGPENWVISPSNFSSTLCKENVDLDFIVEGIRSSGSVFVASSNIGLSDVLIRLYLIDGNNQKLLEETVSVHGNYVLLKAFGCDANMKCKYLVTASHPNWKFENVSLDVESEPCVFSPIILNPFYVKGFSIKGYVYGSETTAENIRISLLHHNGTFIMNTTSTEDGEFLFTPLVPGKYTVVVNKSYDGFSIDNFYPAESQGVLVRDDDTSLPFPFVFYNFSLLTGSTKRKGFDSTLFSVPVSVCTTPSNCKHTISDGTFRFENVSVVPQYTFAYGGCLDYLLKDHRVEQKVTLTALLSRRVEIIIDRRCLCGNVTSKNSAVVEGAEFFLSVGKNEKSYSSFSDRNGLFCFFVPDEFNYEGETIMEVSPEHLKLFPRRRQIKVGHLSDSTVPFLLPGGIHFFEQSYSIVLVAVSPEQFLDPISFLVKIKENDKQDPTQYYVDTQHSEFEETENGRLWHSKVVIDNLSLDDFCTFEITTADQSDTCCWDPLIYNINVSESFSADTATADFSATAENVQTLTLKYKKSGTPLNVVFTSGRPEEIIFSSKGKKVDLNLAKVLEDDSDRKIMVFCVPPIFKTELKVQPISRLSKYDPKFLIASFKDPLFFNVSQKLLQLKVFLKDFPQEFLDVDDLFFIDIISENSGNALESKKCILSSLNPVVCSAEFWFNVDFTPIFSFNREKLVHFIESRTNFTGSANVSCKPESISLDQFLNPEIHCVFAFIIQASVFPVFSGVNIEAFDSMGSKIGYAQTGDDGIATMSLPVFISFKLKGTFESLVFEAESDPTRLVSKNMNVLEIRIIKRTMDPLSSGSSRTTGLENVLITAFSNDKKNRLKVYTGPDGIARFYQIPEGTYYISPILKDHTFQPTQLEIDISHAKETHIDTHVFEAKQFAFNCRGYLKTLKFFPWFPVDDHVSIVAAQKNSENEQNFSGIIIFNKTTPTFEIAGLQKNSEYEILVGAPLKQLQITTIAIHESDVEGVEIYIQPLKPFSEGFSTFSVELKWPFLPHDGDSSVEDNNFFLDYQNCELRECSSKNFEKPSRLWEDTESFLENDISYYGVILDASKSFQRKSITKLLAFWKLSSVPVFSIDKLPYADEYHIFFLESKIKKSMKRRFLDFFFSFGIKFYYEKQDFSMHYLKSMVIELFNLSNSGIRLLSFVKWKVNKEKNIDSLSLTIPFSCFIDENQSLPDFFCSRVLYSTKFPALLNFVNYKDAVCTYDLPPFVSSCLKNCTYLTTKKDLELEDLLLSGSNSFSFDTFLSRVVCLFVIIVIFLWFIKCIGVMKVTRRDLYCIFNFCFTPFNCVWKFLSPFLPSVISVKKSSRKTNPNKSFNNRSLKLKNKKDN